MQRRSVNVSTTALLSCWLVLTVGCNSGKNSPDQLPPASSGTQTPPATGIAAVSWIAPTTRVDGSALTMGELNGYRVYWGTSTNNLDNVDDVPGASSNQFQVSGLSRGTYYFQVTAYDASGVESPRSAVASKVIP